MYTIPFFIQRLSFSLPGIEVEGEGWSYAYLHVVYDLVWFRNKILYLIMHDLVSIILSDFD